MWKIKLQNNKTNTHCFLLLMSKLMKWKYVKITTYVLKVFMNTSDRIIIWMFYFKQAQVFEVKGRYGIIIQELQVKYSAIGASGTRRTARASLHNSLICIATVESPSAVG